MSDFGTNYGEKFARNTLKIYFERAVTEQITNQEWEGTHSQGGADRVNVITFDALSLKTYSGSALTADTPQESEGTMLLDQKKAYYFKIQSWQKFISYVGDPSSELIQTAGKTLAETVDAYVLGLYADVGAGNRVGTDYTTGTVAVTATTGAVAGTGTTFTSAMVGRGFKADGHSTWYRVKTFTSTTVIVIEDDSDDETSAYTGGTIAATATYTVEAATMLQVTKATIYAYIVALKTKLDQAKIPASDRNLVVPSEIAALLLQAPELIPAVPTAYEEVVKRGLLGMISGFTVYQSEQVAGDNTDGYRVLGIHKSWMAFAMAFKESGTEDLIGDFGSAYKGLNVYGAKVFDERRKAGAELFCYV